MPEATHVRSKADSPTKTCHCGRPMRARGLCSTHYNRANAKSVTLTCAGCGVPVVKSNQRSSIRYRAACSDTCRTYLQFGPGTCVVPEAHPSRSTRVPDDHPCRRPLVEIRGSCRVFIPDCATCGRAFVTRYTTSTCSDGCADIKRQDDRRERKHRARARKRSAYVAPVSRRAIYERDRYRCHLCKRKVMVDKPVPHPRAAVLDHVIPLAVGGTHEPANVMTACFLCNSIKGDRGGNEQLMLIG